MRGKLTTKRSRAGVTALLALLAIGVLLVLLAAVLDLGRLGVCRQRLQSTADAAALAAAAQLLGSDNATVKAEALEMIAAARENGALQDETADPRGEIQLGYIGEDEEFVASEQQCEAVEVRLGYSAARGNPLSLFMVRWFGYDQADVEVRSVATASRRLIGFEVTGEEKMPVAPLVIRDDESETSWSQQWPPAAVSAFNDQWSIVDQKVTQGGDGIPEIMVRLNSSAASGWVTSLPGGDSQEAWTRRFAEGLSADDLPNGALGEHSMFGRQSVDPQVLLTSLESIVGQPRVWPLGHQNSRSLLQVTGFAAGQVVQCWDEGGGGIALLVQPCHLNTRNARVDQQATENPFIAKVALAK